MKEENIDFIVTNNLETNLKELDRGLKCLHKFKKIEHILDDVRSYKIFRFIRFVTSLKKFQQELDIDSLFEPSESYDLFSEILSSLTYEKNELNFEDCAGNFVLKVEAEYLVYNLDHEHIFIKWTKTQESVCCGGRLFGQCSSNIKELVKDDLIYKCTICHDYNLCQACFDSPRNEVNLNEQRVFILDDLLAILNNLLPFTIKLRLHLLKSLSTFLDLISSPEFVKNCHEYNSDIILAILSIINWLSKHSDTNKLEWKSLNSIELLLNTLNLSSKFGQLIYNTIAYIIDDEQIENLSGLVQTMVELDVKRLNKFASNFKKDKLVRIKQQFRDENEKVFLHEVMVAMSKLGQVSLTDSLQNIYNLALNPRLKFEIFNRNNFKKELKIIIKHGNEIEKLFSILLLAQLAFDVKVINDLISDPKLVTMIKKIAKNDSIELRKLRIVSKQLLWLIEETNHSNLPSNTPNPEHIMISYHSSNKELCLRIKSELERENNRIWLDSNGLHGSGLDSMAHAVEKSKCVLICVDEKYRKSVKCQAEALYSLKLNKKIIPIIIQKGYENIKGWLGVLITHKNWVDFSNRNFSENIMGLKIKLEDLFKKQEHEQTPTLPQTVSFKAGASQVDEWTESDVENWFKLVNLNNTYIHFALCPCSGKLLCQLRQMQVHAPEFFFKSISPKSLNINDLKTIALFSLELCELFSNENMK